MLSIFPRNNAIDGVINASSNLKLTFNSSSDPSCKHCPFLRTCQEGISWGAKNQNDWLEVSFGNDLLYITHYCITGKNSGRRTRGWNVDAKDKQGVLHRIDTVSNGLLSSNYNEIHKIRSHGPFSSFKFTITDTYQSDSTWYSLTFGIDFFGILNPEEALMKKMFNKTCRKQNKVFNMVPLLLLNFVM